MLLAIIPILLLTTGIMYSAPNQVYLRERDNLLSFSEETGGRGIKKHVIPLPPAQVYSVNVLLERQGRLELLKELLEETSMQFLLAFWYSCDSYRKVILFRSVRCLEHRSLSLYHWKYGNLMDVFENFRDFLFTHFTESHSFSNRPELAEFLNRARGFWHNRLADLGRRLSPPDKFKRDESRTLEHFRIYQHLLQYNTDALALYSLVLNRLCISHGKGEKLPAHWFGCFCFLVNYISVRFGQLPALPDLEWLASQNPRSVYFFLNYFGSNFNFGSYTWSAFILSTIKHRNFPAFSQVVVGKSHDCLEVGGRSILFKGYHRDHRERARKLAGVIYKKYLFFK